MQTWILTLGIVTVLSGAAVALAASDAEGWRRRTLIVSAPLLVLASVASLAIQFRVQTEADAVRVRDQHARARAGQIAPAGSTTCDIVAIRAGNTNYYARRQLRQVNNVPIGVRLDADSRRLLVSAEYRDPRGELVCKIVDNEWVHLSRQYDRNYSQRALEVFDSDSQHPVFQVICSGNMAIVFGQFTTTDGRTLWLTPAGTEVDAGPSAPLEPLFRYPSELHPGSLDDALLNGLTRETETRVLSGIERIEANNSLPADSHAVVIETWLSNDKKRSLALAWD